MRRDIALKAAAFWILLALPISLLAQGCGKSSERPSGDDTRGRPESVTAYDAVQYTKPAADKWYDLNWLVQIRDGSPDGIDKNGKAKVWDVFFFSPTPLEKTQLQVIYNRGNVWPGVPNRNDGGDEGRTVYRKGRPPDFRVDSSEAYTVAIRNGGGEFMDARPDTQVHAVLRCKADFEAVGDEMPAPKYKWIWDIYFEEPKIDSEVLHVYVDGMNGDFITKEVQKPSG
jgi:hypothetical protein